MRSGALDMRLKQEGKETRLVWMKCTDLGQEPEQVHPSACFLCDMGGAGQLRRIQSGVEEREQVTCAGAAGRREGTWMVRKSHHRIGSYLVECVSPLCQIRRATCQHFVHLWHLQNTEDTNKNDY